MHPHVIGYRSRIFILEELIRHIKAAGGAWFATHADIARWCLAQAGITAGLDRPARRLGLQRDDEEAL